MTKARSIIKKIIYRAFGEKTYQKAYAKGKIRDIVQERLDEPELKFLHVFIQPESTVLDIGANYGHYAIEMAKHCPHGKVYAYEPIPFTFNVLKRVVNHFKKPQITIFNAAISHTKSTVKMSVPLLDFGAPNTGIAFVGESEEKKMTTFEVDTLTIDEAKIEGSVDFIKIDIEGHEPSAFKGMKARLEKDLPVILIEFSYSCLKRAGEDPAIFAQQLKQEYNYDFAQVKHDELVWVKDDTPRDGYYFLIPNQRKNQFNIKSA